MRTCAVCNVESDGETCPACGEASWAPDAPKVARRARRAPAAPPEPASSADATANNDPAPAGDKEPAAS